MTMIATLPERLQLFLQSLFEDDMLVEDRPVAYSFQVPLLPIGGGGGGTMDVLLPKLDFWQQLIYLLIIQVIFLLAFAVVIHQCIIVPYRDEKGNKINSTSVFPYLLGYGILIPIVLQLPYPIITYLKLRNHVLRMSLAVLPSNVTFRCIEAMHGTSPSPAVEESLQNYLTYYSVLIDYVWNDKTRKRERITPKQFASLMGQMGMHFCGVSIMLSWLLNCEQKFKPFGPSNLKLDSYQIAWKPNDLANNYVYAVTLFFILSLSFSVGGLSNNIQGYLTRKAFLNPLWTSTSPQDFWGRKWNRVIHEQLKRGAFLPLVKAGGYSKRIGILGAFLASGFLHDYVWSVLFYKSIHEYDDETGELYPTSTFTPLPFKQSVFFLWCALTMVLERPIAKWKVVQWMSIHLPLIVKSTLIVLTALPFAHYYGGDWMMGNYFDEYSHGVFRFIYHPAASTGTSGA